MKKLLLSCALLASLTTPVTTQPVAPALVGGMLLRGGLTGVLKVTALANVVGPSVMSVGTTLAFIAIGKARLEKEEAALALLEDMRAARDKEREEKGLPPILPEEDTLRVTPEQITLKDIARQTRVIFGEANKGWIAFEESMIHAFEEADKEQKTTPRIATNHPARSISDRRPPTGGTASL